jgi:DnaJ homolog subfamily C member 17
MTNSASFDPQDAPVRIKYTLTKRQDLSSEEALLAVLKPFGPVDESCVIFTLKPPKDKPNAPPKFATAIVVFKKVEDAFGVVGATGQESRGMKNVDISWAKGEEPESIKALRERGLLGAESQRSGTHKDGSEARSSGFTATASYATASTFPSSQTPVRDTEIQD